MLLALTSIRLTAPVVVCLSLPLPGSAGLCLFRAAWRSVKSSRADAVAGRPHRRDARGFAITKTRRGILMAARTLPGGTFTMAEDLTVTRMGYGAMQLAGPHVFGPPADRDAAVAVLREAMELGITHIDTSDFYGPHVTNQIIKEALHPYPDSLHIVTKVGALRDAEGGCPQALAPEQLRQAVHDNLDNLGLDALDVVNLRVGGLDSPTPGSIAEPFTVLAQLQQEGLIKQLGLSTVNAAQIAEAQSIAPVVCVQNFYNLAHRAEEHCLMSTTTAPVRHCHDRKQRRRPARSPLEGSTVPTGCTLCRAGSTHTPDPTQRLATSVTALPRGRGSGRAQTQTDH